MRKRLYLITPVADDEEATAEDTIRSLLDQGWYVFGSKTTKLKELDEGDRVCFYKAGKGVVAEAVIVGKAQKKRITFARLQVSLQWAVPIKQPRYFFATPVRLTEAMRRRLEAFKGRNSHNWAWFVFTTRLVSARDFSILCEAKSE